VEGALGSGASKSAEHDLFEKRKGSRHRGGRDGLPGNRRYGKLFSNLELQPQMRRKER